MDIPEFQDNERIKVHFDASTDHNTRSTKSSLLSCDENKIEKIFQINKAMSHKIDELREEVKLLKLGKDSVNKDHKHEVATNETFGVTTAFFIL